MSGARRERVEELFQGALDVPPEKRPSFLHKQCDGDPDLLAELESLLNHFQEAIPHGSRQGIQLFGGIQLNNSDIALTLDQDAVGSCSC